MIPFRHKPSRLKASLQKKELTVGTWLSIPHRSVVEIFGKSGFDWVVIDLEHAPIGIDQTADLISCIQGSGMQALVRVNKNEEVVIKKLLDMGADGIVVPMICSKKDALQLTPGQSAHLITSIMEGIISRFIRNKFKEIPSSYIENYWLLVSSSIFKN